MSISSQTYSNYISVYLKTPNNNYDAMLADERVELVENGYTYNTYKKAINKHCQPNAVVLMVNSPLKPTALRNINYVHQTFSAWVSYSRTPDNIFQIHSFYRRVFDLIELNDFSKSNEYYFDKENPGFLGLSFL